MATLKLYLLLCLSAVCSSDDSNSEKGSSQTETNPILELRKYVERLENRFEEEIQNFNERERRLKNEMEQQRKYFSDHINMLKKETNKCANNIIQQRKVIESLTSEKEERIPTDEMNAADRTKLAAKQNMMGWADESASLAEDRLLRTLKRSDDYGLLQPVVAQMTQQLTEITADIQALKNTNRQQDTAIAAQDTARGTTYTHWGSSSCPDLSETVYSSTMGGSWYNHPGAAVNYLCLAPKPVFDNKPVPANGWYALLYGAEYDTPEDPNSQENAVCSVCRIPRSSTVMIPGTNACSPGWTLEYSGYLMAGLPTQFAAASEYICVDSTEVFIPGTQANDDGKLLYYTVTQCGSLPCPPYANNKVVLCAVCSK